ncbi:MAG: Ig-like domain-containing protein [Gemmatimonas sp.]
MKRLSRFATPVLLVSLFALMSCGGGDTTAPPVVTVATVTVSPSTNALLTGATATLTATLKDASGNTLRGQTVTWSSSAQAVATVSTGGVVTAVAAGTATITATSEGKSGTASITVSAPVATVAVTPPAPAINVGATVTLTADTKDAAGVSLTGRAIAWSSSAQSVATVTQTGVVTAIASGTTTITATSEGKSGTATITVSNPFNPATATTLSGTQRFTSINIPVGVTVTATADLNLSASGAIAIAGTLTGNCVAMTVAADAAASVTGSISNACTDPTVDGKDLTIVGKTGVSVMTSSINSSGEILITNDLALTDANFPVPSGALVTSKSGIRTGAVARAAATAVTPDCLFSGVRPPPVVARPGSAGATTFLPGAAGKGLRMSCRGHGEIGGGAAGGATITGQAGGAGGAGNSTSNTFAEARAGDGGNGGTVRLYVTGELAIVGATNLVSGDGGAGGVAVATAQSNPALNKQPNAQATGGKGGEPRLIDIRAGGAINIAAPLNITIGRAGDGGSGTATAAPGLDATDVSPAKEGGNANATGGEGGSTPNRTLVAFGAINGAAFVTVSGGRAGNGGRATGTAGVGGNGNETFPAGGKGGNLSFNTNNAGNGVNTRVGNGGNAQLKNLLGVVFGRGGDGSITSGTIGNGGAGWNGCVVPRKPGGAGGVGGSAAGRDGSGGTGIPVGVAGGITLTNVGNGGKGGDGVNPGTGGNPGSDATISSGAKNLIAPNFTLGAAGLLCSAVPVRIGVLSDPFLHTPHTHYTDIAGLLIAEPVNEFETIGLRVY